MNTEREIREHPHGIAHRGASAYAYGNTLRAFSLASDMGATFWEVDLRLSADGMVVACHDPVLPDGTPISTLDAADIAARGEGTSAALPLFSQVIELALAREADIYADIKDAGAALPALAMLRESGMRDVVMGTYDPQVVARLEAAGCPFPRAALVPVGADPFEHAGGADIIHPCWESLERPQDLLDRAFFDRCAKTGQRVVLWHEEDSGRMAELRALPVYGICSDHPEMVRPFEPPDDWPVEIVCHRGARRIAPENTLPAARCAFGAGFDYVELDVHRTSDDGLVVIHDPLLDRTTDGTGPVCNRTLAELRALDAGCWFDPYFAGEKLPVLDEVLMLAKSFGGGLYVELKSAPAADVLAAVIGSGMLDSCFFWSFDKVLLHDLRKISERARIMARRQDFPTLAAALGFLDASIIEYDPKDDWSEFASCRAGGARAMAYYGGSDENMFERIVSARPDMINLDDAFGFSRYLRAR